MRELGVECEIELLKPVICKQLAKDPIALKDKSLYDPSINNNYFRLTYCKHEAFYQALMKYGSALLIDADTAIFEDFIPDIEEILKTKSLILRDHYYCHNINFNAGFYAAKRTPEVVNFFETFLSYLTDYLEPTKIRIDDEIMVQSFTVCMLLEHRDKVEFISDKIHSLNHAGVSRLDAKQIKETKVKSFHITSYTVSQKVQILKDLDQWFAGDYIVGDYISRKEI